MAGETRRRPHRGPGEGREDIDILTLNQHIEERGDGNPAKGKNMRACRKAREARRKTIVIKD
jgi:hypothetical protein